MSMGTLKGNPHSKGPAKGLASVRGPLGIYSKKHTWESINQMMRVADYQKGQLFSEQERRDMAARNTGLNAYQMAGLHGKIKRQYETRRKASWAILMKIDPNPKPV